MAVLRLFQPPTRSRSKWAKLRRRDNAHRRRPRLHLHSRPHHHPLHHRNNNNSRQRWLGGDKTPPPLRCADCREQRWQRPPGRRKRATMPAPWRWTVKAPILGCRSIKGVAKARSRAGPAWWGQDHLIHLRYLVRAAAATTTTTNTTKAKQFAAAGVAITVKRCAAQAPQIFPCDAGQTAEMNKSRTVMDTTTTTSSPATAMTSFTVAPLKRAAKQNSAKHTRHQQQQQQEREHPKPQALIEGPTAATAATVCGRVRGTTTTTKATTAKATATTTTRASTRAPTSTTRSTPAKVRQTAPATATTTTTAITTTAARLVKALVIAGLALNLLSCNAFIRVTLAAATVAPAPPPPPTTTPLAAVAYPAATSAAPMGAPIGGTEATTPAMAAISGQPAMRQTVAANSNASAGRRVSLLAAANKLESYSFIDGGQQRHSRGRGGAPGGQEEVEGNGDEADLPPIFDFGMPRNITGRTGHTEALIKCRVDNINDKSVSWIRKRDLHILTVGTATYTTDKRFEVTESRDSREWTLHVKAPLARDSGIYECQVNTEPKISMAFQLNVIEISPDAKALISGPPDLHFKVGSAIILNCLVQQPAKVRDIGPIYWYRGDQMITPFDTDELDVPPVGSNGVMTATQSNDYALASAAASGGPATLADSSSLALSMAATTTDDRGLQVGRDGNTLDEEATVLQQHKYQQLVMTNDLLTPDFASRIAMESQLGDTLKSRLRISNAQTTDTGNYTCQPTTASSASVMVHVINDENPAAMQKSGAATMAASTCFGAHLFLMAAVTLALSGGGDGGLLPSVLAMLRDTTANALVGIINRVALPTRRDVLDGAAAAASAASSSAAAAAYPPSATTFAPSRRVTEIRCYATLPRGTRLRRKGASTACSAAFLRERARRRRLPRKGSPCGRGNWCNCDSIYDSCYCCCTFWLYSPRDGICWAGRP